MASAPRYLRERAKRRKLSDELADLKGNIRVVARCRPGGGSLDEAVAFPPGADGAVEVVNDNGLTQRFEFDAVFRPGSTQSEVFDRIAPVIQSCFDGRHACIFAYGQTGSGKTYTMEGPPDDRGVYFRALSELFHARPHDAAVSVRLSMLEIYNETIRDLLAKKPLAKLDVRQTGDGLHGVPGLATVDVSSLEEVQRHMEAGANARSVGAHDLNARSSRSHLLVSLDVTTTRECDAKTARLHLVDLAGSERLSRTGATGDRLKEAQAINKSLSALGDVINALAKKIPGHVPSATERGYRALQGVVRR